MIIAVDMDGTLCSWHPGEYEKAEPYYVKIEVIRKFHAEGHSIWIYTARGSSLGSEEKAQQRWEEITVGQLSDWKVPYKRLIFGKPTYDVLIDDRSINFNNDWSKQLDEVMMRLNDGDHK